MLHALMCTAPPHRRRGDRLTRVCRPVLQPLHRPFEEEAAPVKVPDHVLAVGRDDHPLRVAWRLSGDAHLEHVRALVGPRPELNAR